MTYKETVQYYPNGQCKEYYAEGDINFKINPDKSVEDTSNHSGHVLAQYNRDGYEIFYCDEYCKREYHNGKNIPSKFTYFERGITYGFDSDGNINSITETKDGDMPLGLRFPNNKILLVDNIINDDERLKKDLKCLISMGTIDPQQDNELRIEGGI